MWVLQPMMVRGSNQRRERICDRCTNRFANNDSLPAAAFHTCLFVLWVLFEALMSQEDGVVYADEKLGTAERVKTFMKNFCSVERYLERDR